MNELELTGGAKIGNVNVSDPLATLKLNQNQLELNASLFGNLIFQSSDILSIEPYTKTQLIGHGLKINHNVVNYSQEVIFWTFENPNSIVQQIKATGFLTNQNASDYKLDQTIIEKQLSGAIPIKKGFRIGALVIWIVLFLSDIIPLILEKKGGFPVGNGILSAFGLLSMTLLLSLISSDFRRLILKKGRELDDIKRVVYFILIISGFIFSFLFIVTKMHH